MLLDDHTFWIAYFFSWKKEINIFVSFDTSVSGSYLRESTTLRYPEQLSYIKEVSIQPFSLLKQKSAEADTDQT